jgi:hypothetical protein
MTLNDLGLPGVVGGGLLSDGAAPPGASTPGLKAPPPLLPFGPTLHYRGGIIGTSSAAACVRLLRQPRSQLQTIPGARLTPPGPRPCCSPGCGCPYSWAAGCRLCDWGDSWLQQAHSRLSPAPECGGGGDGADGGRLAPARKLKVAYCLPHAAVTGGLKILLEHMRLLRARGHCVVALTRSELAESAVPRWSDVAVDADVVCRAGQRFRDVYDVDDCDVVVTGIFHQARRQPRGQPPPPAAASRPAPLLPARGRRQAWQTASHRMALAAQSVPHSCPPVPRCVPHSCPPVPVHPCTPPSCPQIPEWLTTTSAPVLYYEQGHEWLFGDPLRFREAGGARDQDALFHATMHLPVALAAVSGGCAGCGRHTRARGGVWLRLGDVL